MKSKKMVWGIVTLVIVLIAVVIGVVVARRLSARYKDIIGVTTLRGDNTVIMNSPSADAFVSGSGQITVSEGEQIHLEYSVSSGSFDLAFHEGTAGRDVFKAADLGHLTLEGEVFGASAVSGEGSLDFEVAPGEYTVYFNMHGTIGSATVDTKK